MNKNKVVILNITHGDNPYCDKPPFLPIAAGACRHDITTDADGEDNISKKNRWYGDFTSIYWAWKNLKNVDVIGTSHYRRYILDEDSSTHKLFYTWEEFCSKERSVSSFCKELEKYDFIMPYPVDFQVTLREQYVEAHPYPENLKLVDSVLKEMCPEASLIWEKYMNGHTMRYGFLFITTWSNFDQLCSWLYPILQRCEERLSLSNFSGYQERVIAFLYERLVPVFIETYGMTVKSYPMCLITESMQVLYYEREQYEQMSRFYKDQYEQIRKSKAYRLGKFLLHPFNFLRRKK